MKPTIESLQRRIDFLEKAVEDIIVLLNRLIDRIDKQPKRPTK